MNSPRAAVLLSLLLVSMLSPRSGDAAEIVSLQPSRANGWLLASLRATDLLDARTRSTIESGLPGSLGLTLVVEEEGGRVVGQTQLRRSLLLDLWEGTVRLEEGDRESTFWGLAAADSAWARFDALKIVPTSSLSEAGRYRIHAELRVRPLGADDRDRVANWVSRSDRGERTDVRLDVGRLLSHFVAGGQRDLEGSVRRSSAFFRLSTLLKEAPDP